MPFSLLVKKLSGQTAPHFRILLNLDKKAPAEAAPRCEGKRVTAWIIASRVSCIKPVS